MKRGRVQNITAYVMLGLGALIFLTLWFGYQGPDMCFKTENRILLEDGWKEETAQGLQAVSLPVKSQAEKGEPVRFYRSFRERRGSRNALLVRSTQQEMKVYWEDSLLYEYGDAVRTPFPLAPANAWHLITLPEGRQGGTLCVEVTSQVKSYAGYLPEVYIGDRASLLSLILYQALPGIFLSLLVIVMGFGILAGVFLFKEKVSRYRIVWLGMFALLTGAWSLVETRSSQFLTGNLPAVNTLVFLCFPLMPVCLIRFLLTYPVFDRKNGMHLLFYVSTGVFLFMQAAQITGLIAYVDSVTVVHAELLLVGALILWTGLRERKNVLGSPHLFAACGALTVLSLVDIIRFYLPMPRSDDALFSRIGMVFFIFLLGLRAIKDASRDHSERLEQEMWRQMAFTDALTGLGNRAAFRERMEKCREKQKEEKIRMLIMDMNDLKRVNDAWGHVAGDEAIALMGGLLQKAFAGLGDCYRIGGDEFSVIGSGEEEPFQERLRVFLKKVKTAGQEKSYPFSAAWGYYEAPGEEIDEIYRQADRKMYEQKGRMKITDI